MKGFKILNSDWTTQNGDELKVGESFELNSDPKVGSHGFHFCRNLIDCYDYFISEEPKKYTMIEAYGEIDNNGTKEYATDKIKIIKELNWDEVKEQIFKEVVCR